MSSSDSGGRPRRVDAKSHAAATIASCVVGSASSQLSQISTGTTESSRSSGDAGGDGSGTGSGAGTAGGGSGGAGSGGAGAGSEGSGGAGCGSDGPGADDGGLGAGSAGVVTVTTSGSARGSPLSDRLPETQRRQRWPRPATNLRRRLPTSERAVVSLRQQQPPGPAPVLARTRSTLARRQAPRPRCLPQGLPLPPGPATARRQVAGEWPSGPRQSARYSSRSALRAPSPSLERSRCRSRPEDPSASP